jgi:spore coat protein U-like protein
VDLDFGPIQQMSPTPTDAQSTITVACSGEPEDLTGLPPTATVDYVVSINAGSSGNFLARNMVRSGGGDMQGYNLFVDSGRMFIWGDGTSGTLTQGGTFSFDAIDVTAGTQKSAEHLVYGRVPAGVNALPGTYSDLVTVTLSF